jgi:hypothetical protein
MRRATLSDAARATIFFVAGRLAAARAFTKGRDHEFHCPAKGRQRGDGSKMVSLPPRYGYRTTEKQF